MSSLLYMSTIALMAYTSFVRYKVRKEKPNALGIALMIWLVFIGFVPLALALFTSNRFFDEYIEDFTGVFMLVLCAMSITDIAFGTFSKPGTARKVPKKYPVWVWIASFVGAWVVTLGVIFVTIMLASNY